MGLYSVAYNLASIPNVLLLGALQPTFLAAGAKLQNDRQRLAQGWLLGLACVMVLVTPASVVFAMLSADLVSLLYGPAWMDSAWVLALLFLCLPAWACWGFSTPVLWNTGRKHLEYQLQLPMLAVAAPAWWLIAPSGIRSAAIVSALVIVARAGVIIAAALRALGAAVERRASDAARGLFLSAVCAAAVLAGKHAVATLTFPGVSLYAGGICAVAAMLLLVATRPQLLGVEALSALARLFPRSGCAGARPRCLPTPRGRPDDGPRPDRVPALGPSSDAGRAPCWRSCCRAATCRKCLSSSRDRPSPASRHALAANASSR